MHERIVPEGGIAYYDDPLVDPIPINIEEEFVDEDEIKVLNFYAIKNKMSIWKKIATLKYKTGQMEKDIMEKIKYNFLSIPDSKLNPMQLRVYHTF